MGGPYEDFPGALEVKCEMSCSELTVFWFLLEENVQALTDLCGIAVRSNTGMLVVFLLLAERLKNMRRAASEPSVTTLTETKDWALLQCVVRGASPKPKVFWQDSAGNVLPAKEPEITQRGDSYDIILQITVTKTDNYRCVATQEEISHQTQTEIYIHMNEFPTVPTRLKRLKDRTEENIPGAAPRPIIMIVDETKDWALLQCEVEGAFPKPKVFWQDSAGNILPSPEPQVSETGGRFYVTLQTTVTKTGRFRCVATQEETGHQIHTETFVHLSGAASKPYVTTLTETKDWALLHCEVLGVSPKPKVFWQDSAGNVLPAKEPEITERGDSYDIILQITVTKTDNYRCVATQEEISHQTQTETYVHMNDKRRNETLLQFSKQLEQHDPEERN
ncbi:hemicentin-1-like [Odontesthes bonariensis]